MADDIGLPLAALAAPGPDGWLAGIGSGNGSGTGGAVDAKSIEEPFVHNLTSASAINAARHGTS